MNVTTEQEQISPVPDVKVYKPPKSYLVLSIFCLTFFPLIGVGGIALSLLNPDGSFARPVLFAIFDGLFFGGWTLLSLYMLVACRRCRLYASSDAIRTVGVFRSMTALFADVTRAVWRSWPRGGSIVLHTAESRIVIGFANYEGGKELAGFLHANLPAELQANYERFESTNVPSSVAFQEGRSRQKRSAGVVMPILGVALIALAVWDP
jgi:hypothetical protein